MVESDPCLMPLLAFTTSEATTANMLMGSAPQWLGTTVPTLNSLFNAASIILWCRSHPVDAPVLHSLPPDFPLLPKGMHCSLGNFLSPCSLLQHQPYPRLNSALVTHAPDLLAFSLESFKPPFTLPRIPPPHYHRYPSLSQPLSSLAKLMFIL